MGRFQQRSEDSSETGYLSGDANNALRLFKEELQIIQRTLLKSLQEDIRRLQIQKDDLVNDVQQLQTEKDDLRKDQQINEKQTLVSQLGQVLASHISSQLHNSLEKLAIQEKPNKTVPITKESVNGSDDSGYSYQKYESVKKILGTLDETLTVTIQSLQQEIKNYQNSLSQQLSQMQNQQQQGELILVELVNRLHKKLDKNTTQNSVSDLTFKDTPNPPNPGGVLGGSPTIIQPDLPIGGMPTIIQPDESPIISSQTPQIPSADVPTAIQTDEFISQDAPSCPLLQMEGPELTTSSTQLSPNGGYPDSIPSTIPPGPGTNPLRFAQFIYGLLKQPQGLFLIILSTLISSLYNVTIRVMFQPESMILGVFEVEQLILPTLGNSLLILMLRMLVVMPLMLVLAPILYPKVWLDLQELIDAFKASTTKHDRSGQKALILCFLGGFFLFLSQVLIYIAIGQVSASMVITLFFIYPTISSLLSWFLLQDFPTPFRAITISTIFLGELLVLGGVVRTETGNLFLGSLSAIIAGAMFGCYVVTNRIGSTKVHPVTFTLINFTTILMLCFTSLMILPFFSAKSLSRQVSTNKILELILTAFLLGMLTLCGYIFNSFGVRKLGVSHSSVIGAMLPIITIIFAGIIIQESLQPLQIMGVLLIAFGSAAISFENIYNQIPSSNSP